MQHHHHWNIHSNNTHKMLYKWPSKLKSCILPASKKWKIHEYQRTGKILQETTVSFHMACFQSSSTTSGECEGQAEVEIYEEGRINAVMRYV
eukprot:9861619-Ditylum_brightwellii.AAC.1